MPDKRPITVQGITSSGVRPVIPRAGQQRRVIFYATATGLAAIEGREALIRLTLDELADLILGFRVSELSVEEYAQLARAADILRVKGQPS